MNALLVCLIAALCTVQIADVKGDSLNVLRAQLQRAKGQVDRVINDLTRSKNNLRFDLDNKVYNVKFPAMQSINSMINPAMEEIRSAANAAKESGKNSDNCLESGRLALRDISQTAFSTMDSCQNTARQAIVPAQNNMDATITVARQLNAELDGIFPKCYSNNIYQMQSCIALALGQANITIRSLESTADTVKSSGNTAANNALLEGSVCIRNAVNDARPKVPNAVNSAKNCINNL